MTEEQVRVFGPSSRWVLASIYGWWLGLLVVVVLAIAADLVGFMGGADSQFMVGVGFGGGVGYVQSRVLRKSLARPISWMVASAIGMGSPFLVRDAIVASGGTLPYSLPAYVLVGSVITGAWQSALLRQVSAHPNRWVVGSLLGWGAPAALIALGDTALGGPVGGLLSAATVLLGGAILGAVSSRFTRSVVRRAPV